VVGRRLVAGDHLVQARARCRWGHGGTGRRCRDQRPGEATCALRHRRTSGFKWRPV